MTERTERSWVPDGLLLDKPNPARLYDYFLGGFHNFAADRELADAVAGFYPEVRVGTVAQRAFVRRVVRFLVGRGIDQFLDLGSGLPTAGNVHQAAQAADPAVRVVYVDNDPVVLAHSQMLLEDDPNTTLICEDLRDTEAILNHEDVAALLDLSRPLVLMSNAVLHYVTDDAQAYGAIRRLVEPLVPGSYATISHVSFDGASREVLDKAREVYRAAAEVTVRTREQIRQFFDGLELVEPGVVRGPLWRPESPDDVLLDHPERYLGFVGVGRKV
ncbi:MAG: SAM-dependent methyltransferase [Anaerolineae bacterium]|jgi:SAM-dependent methyltransferase